MPSRRHFFLRWLLLFLAPGLSLAIFSTALCGQPLPPTDATAFGERVDLGPNWLFAPGDQPAYASAAFDDSHWQIVSTENPIYTYGYHDLQFAWYRIHIHLRPGPESSSRNLAISFLNASGSYEVFANGTRIGNDGDMAGMLRFARGGLRTYPLHGSLIGPDGQLTLAIRFALDAAGNRGRGSSTPLDSDSRVSLISLEAARYESSYSDAHSAASLIALAAIGLLTGCVALALLIAMPAQREYLLVTLYLFASSSSTAVLAWENLHTSTIAVECLNSFLTGIADVALIEFVRRIIHRPLTRWLFALECISFLAPLGAPLANSGIGPIFVAFLAFFLPVLTVIILLQIMLLRAWIRGNREARVLLPAMLFYGLAQYWNFARYLAFFLHNKSAIAPVPVLHIGSYSIGLTRLDDFVFYITILLFLVLRTVSIARERARAAGELAAARGTQQLLLARSSQPTPGFNVETVYHPASEVGGDFFHVAISPSGDLLVVMGDVSGKGLIAAMRVSMILGILRREDSWQPATILHNLNQALFAPGEGFTTACCLLVQPNGAYTIANAGQINPYRDGQEVATSPSLPLGLASDLNYDETAGQISLTERLVLISDGVLEAGSATGKLLGFERLSDLTRKPANEIADTAMAFGQEDDITVLVINRVA